MKWAKLTSMIALMMVQACGVTHSAEYFLSPDGDDEAAGTREAPWRTLEKASLSAQPGDTVTLLPGEYPGALVPAVGGTAEEPIVFRAEPRLGARLIGSGDGSHAVVLRELSHLRLEGLHIAPRPDRGAWVLMQNCTNVTLDDCRMEGARGGMPMHFEDCEDIRVLNCVIHRHIGSNMFRISNCTRVLMEGNTISRTGHSPLQLWPDSSNQYVVMRGNVFHAAWGRNFEHFGTQNVLFEHNIITHALNSGRSASANAKFATTRGIFRFNRVFRNPHGAIHLYPFREVDLDTMRFYNNVFDENGHYGIAVTSASQQTRNLVFANNIFSRNDPHGSERQIRLSGGTAEQVRLVNNVFAGTRPGLPLVHDGDARTVEALQSDGGGRYVDNIDVDPGFADPRIYNHALREDSPLRDAGAPLTRAVAAGEGTLLAVEDAAYFYDGFGIEGEQGDLIAVGAADRRARVTAVDHEANTLLLDRPVSWNAGDPVSLPWSGEGPDIGVYEHGPDGRVSVQVVAEPFAARPGEPVTLRAVVHGDARPAEIRWWLGDGSVAEGAEVTHAYAEAYDYAIRVRVTDTDGRAHYGPGYVWVAEETDPSAPLVHSTWDRDDDSAWWLWKSYRPMPARFRDVVDDTGRGHRHVFAEEDQARLPAQINPVGWDIDRYPRVLIRYRLGEGTPIGIHLRTFSGRIGVVAASPAAQIEDAPRIADHVLHDDGEWHELEFDARLIRERESDVRVIEGLHIIDRPRSAVREGHYFDLDEVIIAPATDG
ncbi:MAG: right-handed parallel beta-helix repeat-containing protein [Armatimonadota bacterium]|jgi:hypothetical protein